jgi:hypothetical protein
MAARVRRPRPIQAATFGEAYDYGFSVPSRGEEPGERERET